MDVVNPGQIYFNGWSQGHEICGWLMITTSRKFARRWLFTLSLCTSTLPKNIFPSCESSTFTWMEAALVASQQNWSSFGHQRSAKVLLDHPWSDSLLLGQREESIIYCVMLHSQQEKAKISLVPCIGFRIWYSGFRTLQPGTCSRKIGPPQRPPPTKESPKRPHLNSPLNDEATTPSHDNQFNTNRSTFNWVDIFGSRSKKHPCDWYTDISTIVGPRSKYKWSCGEITFLNRVLNG